MNFSGAVQGALSNAGAMRYISSQAELELGRCLTQEEETTLFGKFSPKTISSRIQKVRLNYQLVYRFN